MCRECSLELPQPTRVCIGCAHASSGGRTCIVCRKTWSLDGVSAALAYEDTAKQLIHALKYHHLRESADMLGILLASTLRTYEFHAVTAVPVATTHLRRRGYNQAELIGRRVAKELALPYRRLLWRGRNVHQVGKTRAQRLAQMEGVFGTRGSNAGGRILIVDDVATTGATLNACAAALKASGADVAWGAAAVQD